jgi:hypothetical protein
MTQHITRYAVRCVSLLATLIVLQETEGRARCNTDYKNSIEIAVPELKSTYPDYEKVSVKIMSSETSLDVNVLSRQLYVDLRLHQAGIFTELHKTVDMPPDGIESKEWIERGQCKIGETCEVNGECWGSDAQKCRDDTTYRWVASSSEIRELTWTKSLFRTCTKLWDCNLKKENKDLFVDGNGDLVLWIDGKITIPKQATHFHHTIGRRSFFALGPFKVKTEYSTLDCFRNEGTLFCKGKKKDLSHIMVTFRDGEPCKMYLRNTICLVAGDGSTLWTRQDKLLFEDSQTMNFENIKEIMQVETARLFRNDYLNEMAIRRNSEILVRLITEMSSTNPLLVGRLSGESIITGKMNTDGTLQYAMCESTTIEECSAIHKATGTTHLNQACNKQSPVGSMTKISLFSLEPNELDYPQQFDLNKETRDTWVSNEEEREFKEQLGLNSKDKLGSSSSHWTDYLYMSPILGWFTTNLTYLNTIMIIVLLLKK